MPVRQSNTTTPNLPLFAITCPRLCHTELDKDPCQYLRVLLTSPLLMLAVANCRETALVEAAQRAEIHRSQQKRDKVSSSDFVPGLRHPDRFSLQRMKVK